MEKYKIGIIEDHTIFRNGLKMIINQHENLEVIVEGGHGKEFIDQIENDNSKIPDLVLCDMEMPVMDGVATVKYLNANFPDIKITILSGHYEAALILKMLEIGASAFVPKDEKPEELYLSILNVIKHGFHYNQYVVQLIREKMLFGVKKQRAELVELSNREKEVLHEICEQKTNKEIAEKLFISVRTVEGHRNNLIQKTQSKNTAGIIVYAIENGLFKVNLKNKNNWDI